MFTWKILEVSAKDGLITHARYHVTASSEDKSVETEGHIFKTINDLAKHLGINRSTLGVRMHRNPEKYGIKVVGKTKEIAKGSAYYGSNDLTPFEEAIAK